MKKMQEYAADLLITLFGICVGASEAALFILLIFGGCFLYLSCELLKGKRELNRQKDRMQGLHGKLDQEKREADEMSADQKALYEKEFRGMQQFYESEITRKSGAISGMEAAQKKLQRHRRFCLVGIAAIVLVQNKDKMGLLGKNIVNCAAQILEMAPKRDTGPDGTEETEQEQQTCGTEQEMSVINDSEKPGETEAEKHYDQRCRMKLPDRLALGGWDTALTDVVFFGVLDQDPGFLDEEELCKEITVNLTGRIGLKEMNCIDAGFIPAEDQEKILSLTQRNDYFLDEVSFTQKNPPYLPGSALWYNLLPPAETLAEIIKCQEENIAEYPDQQIAQQIYTNCWNLGQEYVLQKGYTEEAAICFGYAALFLLRKLEFTGQDYSQTLDDLQKIYERLSEFGTVGGQPVGRAAALIGRAVGRFMVEKGYSTPYMQAFPN